jgi:hypothetical protein
VESVKAIDVGNIVAMVPQERGEHQQPDGFSPKIKGGKIVNPGVDQKNMGGVIHAAGRLSPLCRLNPLGRLACLAG